MARTTKTAGTIEERAKGVYCVRVFLGQDPVTGQQKRHNKTIHGTKKDAQEYLNRVLRDRDLGKPIGVSRTTLAAHMQSWLDGPVKARGKKRTHYDYGRIARLYILPTLGNVRLDKLTTKAVDELYARLLVADPPARKKPLAAKSIRLVHSVLHSSLEQAVTWDLIAFNPAQRATKPRVPKKEMAGVDLARMRTFLELCLEDRYGFLLVFAIVTGMRPGELQGLHRDDVNTVTGMVRVRYSCEWIGSEWRIAEVKTAKGRRSVRLPKQLLKWLAVHLQQQVAERQAFGDQYTDHGLLFPRLNGAPFETRTVAGYHLKPLLKKAGLPNLRLYDCRHACATLLLEDNVHPKKVAERLGHASTTMTLDVYSHVTPTMQEEVSDRMGILLFPPALPATSTPDRVVVSMFPVNSIENGVVIPQVRVPVVSATILPLEENSAPKTRAV